MTWVPLSDEDRQALAALEEREKKHIYDLEWKRLYMAVVEMDRARIPGGTEHDRNWIRQRRSEFCDSCIATNTGEYWLQLRESMKRTRQGRRLPPDAGYDERLIALANRLEISLKGCPPLTHDGRRFVDPDAPQIERLLDAVKSTLLIMQPEFQTMTFGAGRPRGRRNKVLVANVSKEALRQRRRRQKKSRQILELIFVAYRPPSLGGTSPHVTRCCHSRATGGEESARRTKSSYQARDPKTRRPLWPHLGPP
jgi:hypothetical protein